MSTVPRISLAERPRFAAKMIAVWRWHHMAQGEDLTVTVMPGEWPEGVEREVKGCQVVEHDAVGGNGGVLVLGRVGEKWRAAYQIAVQPWLVQCSVQDLAVATVFMEVGEDHDLTFWLHPDPVTGDVPMWTRNPS